MVEDTFRGLSIHEDDVPATLELLDRIAAERTGADVDYLRNLAVAIRQGIRYGGQYTRKADD